jgi:hypothetical protein
MNAGYSSARSELWFSDAVARDMAKDIKTSPRIPVFGKWTAGSDAYGTVRHEIGHVAFDTLPSEARTTWGSLYAEMGKVDIGKTVSGYAAANADECFAEAFLVWSSKHGGARRRLPERMFLFMKQWIGM